MSNKKSETLKQREKARKDFLELKAMQKENEGNEEKERVPYEGEIKPVTFLSKLSHFWYYYKIPLMFIVMAIAVVTFICIECMGKVKSDITIVLYDNRVTADFYIPAMEEYFEQYCEDINGDGKVKVTVINCTYGAGTSTAEYQQQKMQKLQSLIVTGNEYMLYLLSQNGYNYITTYISEDFFDSNTPLSDDFTAFVEDKIITGDAPEEMPPVHKGFTLYKRRIEGTLMEKNEKAQKALINAQDLIDKLVQAK